MIISKVLADLAKTCPDYRPDCRIALLPVLNTTDGSLSYDVSRYVGIKSSGAGVAHYCVEALGLPGVQGLGGIDSTGNIVTPR